MPTYVAGEKEPAKAIKKQKKELDHLRIMKADNGGHIVEHHFNNSGMGPMVEPERHVFGKEDGGKLLDHVAHHMGVIDTEEEGESES